MAERRLLESSECSEGSGSVQCYRICSACFNSGSTAEEFRRFHVPCWLLWWKYVTDGRGTRLPSRKSTYRFIRHSVMSNPKGNIVWNVGLCKRSKKILWDTYWSSAGKPQPRWRLVLLMRIPFILCSWTVYQVIITGNYLFENRQTAVSSCQLEWVENWNIVVLFMKDARRCTGFQAQMRFSLRKLAILFTV